MLGAIIGDISGSRFERYNHKSKDFELFVPHCRPTDDSIMTLAVAKAILLCGGDYSALGENAVKTMQGLGRKYPFAGYGGRFIHWIFSQEPQPYNSFGNGAAMRVSPCGYAAKSLEEAKELSLRVTEVTHNHPEGLKGAEATAVAIFLAREKKSIEQIRDFINDNYYPMNFTLDEIRQDYKFDVTCQGSVPQAIKAFIESTSFEDAIRNAVSIGGDSDTIAAVTGSIAAAYYGIPDNIKTAALEFLDENQLAILEEFQHRFAC